MDEVEQQAQSRPSEEDYRKLWVASEQLTAENTELKKRIERLEREIACNAFGGLTLH